MPERHICFVKPEAYRLFNPASGRRFGGSEVRAYLFATGLARLPGSEVSFVVFDHGQGVERRDGVTLYPHSGYRRAGWRGRWRRAVGGAVRRVPRFPYVLPKHFTVDLLPKAAMLALDAARAWAGERLRRLLWPGRFIDLDGYLIAPEKLAIYQSIDAGVYCTVGLGRVTAELAAFCRHAGKRLVLISGSDGDFDPTYRPGVREHNRYACPKYLCHYALTQAAALVTQTEYQRSLAREHFGRDAVVVRNPVDLSRRVDAPLYAKRDIALWVGRSDKIKRPGLCIALARRYPDVRFVMVVNRVRDHIHKPLLAEKPPNVMLYEHVPFEEIETLFARAFVFVNTSAHEGFPNTFLQAGKYGVPLLALAVDPDGFISREGCGVAAGGDFEAFVAGLQSILDDRDGPRRFSRNVRAYVKANHELGAQVRRLLAVLEEQLC